MSAILDYMRLCRLCLVKDKVNVPIFGDTSDVRQIFLKISACLPVKVSQDDNLPKSICDTCLYKVDLLYQFWNTTVNAEKQLIQWLAEIGVDVNIKTPNPPQLRIVPQSHAHPHSMPEAIVLKEERQDPDMKAMEHSGQNFHMDHQNMYSGFEMPYPPQVNMTVGAPTDFTQPTDAPAEEEVKVPQQKPQPTQPTPAKRRGRPPKQKTPPSSAPVATTVTVSAAPTTSNSKRRSSAAAAAAAVAAAAANVSSDESDFDDRTGADDSDDEDMDIRIAKEEADSDDEEYVDNPESLEPTTFVGVPSTSACDSEQPGPSGLGGSTTTAKTSSALPANAANETGSTRQQQTQHPLQATSRTETFCTICNLKFCSRQKFMVHKQALHAPIKLAPNYVAKTTACGICKKVLRSTNSLQQHKLIHAGLKPFPCEICSKSFFTVRNLRVHMQTHTGEKPFKCLDCGKSFSQAYCLKIHRRLHSGERPYQCKHCNKTFISKSAIRVHVKIHNKSEVKQYSHTCDECGKRFITSTKLLHHKEAEHRGIRYPCLICDKKFRSAYYLNHHARIHDDNYSPRAFVCNQCNKGFETNRSLKKHIETIHEKTAPVYMCDICGKIVSSSISLRDHRSIHTGYKPFKCSYCDKSFIKRGSLLVHIRVHTQEKPYPCEECGKSFSQIGTLKQHRRLHSGERPFKCKICDKRYVSQSALKLHTKSHGVSLGTMKEIKIHE